MTKDPRYFFETGSHIFCQTCVNLHHPCSSTTDCRKFGTRCLCEFFGMKRPSHVAKRASKKERVVLKSALEKPKKVGSRAKWCETCNQLKRDGPRHKFDFPSHTLRPLVAAEREAYAEELSQDHEYKLDFGKHKKKSSVWIRTHAPSYIAWMVRERVYDKRPQLKEALVSKGFFPDSLLNIVDDKERCTRALSVIDSWQSGTGTKDEPTVKAVPSDVDKTLVEDTSEVVPAEEKETKKKNSEKKQRHLKYMHPDQQTEAYANRTRPSLVERKHTGQQLHRMFAQPWHTIGGQPLLFGLSRTPKPPKVIGCSTRGHERQVLRIGSLSILNKPLPILPIRSYRFVMLPFNFSYSDRADGYTHIPKESRIDIYMLSRKFQLIDHASIHPVHFDSFSPT